MSCPKKSGHFTLPNLFKRPEGKYMPWEAPAPECPNCFVGETQINMNDVQAESWVHERLGGASMPRRKGPTKEDLEVAAQEVEHVEDDNFMNSWSSLGGGIPPEFSDDIKVRHAVNRGDHDPVPRVGDTVIVSPHLPITYVLRGRSCEVVKVQRITDDTEDSIFGSRLPASWVGLSFVWVKVPSDIEVTGAGRTRALPRTVTDTGKCIKGGAEALEDIDGVVCARFLHREVR